MNNKRKRKKKKGRFIRAQDVVGSNPSTKRKKEEKRNVSIN
jgi:hypothetical protein